MNSSIIAAFLPVFGASTKSILPDPALKFLMVAPSDMIVSFFRARNLSSERMLSAMIETRTGPFRRF
jgi:hypothetical protein